MDARNVVKRLLIAYPDIMPEVRELNQKLNEIKDLQLSDTVRAVTPQKAKSGPTNKTSDPTGDLVARYEAEARRYVDRINALLDQKRDTEHMLAQLEPVERRIVELRYINNPPYRCDIWAWIGGQVHYSRAQVKNIHNRALDKMAKWYKT